MPSTTTTDHDQAAQDTARYVRDVFMPLANTWLNADNRLRAALATIFPPSTPTRCALCSSIQPKRDMQRIGWSDVAAIDLCPTCANSNTISLADLRDAATREAATLQAVFDNSEQPN